MKERFTDKQVYSAQDLRLSTIFQRLILGVVGLLLTRRLVYRQAAAGTGQGVRKAGTLDSTS